MNSENRVYGYCRVSSKSQNENRQVDAMLSYGVAKRDIFVDKASGKDFDRPQYEVMKSLLRPGDELVVLDLDRLGRNYNDMAREWQDITVNKGCSISVINFPLLSTSKQIDSSLDSRLIADIIFRLLSYCAERERLSTKERQREGIAAAQSRGTKFGRPKIARPDNFSEVYQRVKNREITNVKAMELLNLKSNVYYTFAREERV